MAYKKLAPRSRQTNVNTDGIVRIKRTPSSCVITIRETRGKLLSYDRYPIDTWTPDIAAIRVQEHRLNRIKLYGIIPDTTEQRAFSNRGIEIIHQSVVSPSNDNRMTDTVLKMRKSRTPEPFGIPRAVKPSSQLVASYEGIVESMDDDEHATTMLEDADGCQTEVRFSTPVLINHGISLGSRFIYQVYATRDGGGYKLMPSKPRQLTRSEWEALALDAKDIAAMLPNPEQNDHKA